MSRPIPPRLAAIAAFAALLAACAPRATAPSPARTAPLTAPTAPALSPDLPDEQSAGELLGYLNAARQGGAPCPDGARPPATFLAPTLTLADAARAQAAFMAETGRVTHAGADGSTPKARVAARGEPAANVSEIIYMSAAGSPEEALRWWLGSNLHCAVLADPRYANAGAGVAQSAGGTAYVVVLGGP